MERDALALGREAFRRNAWAEAHAAFVAADREVPLAPEDIERSALAAHLIGNDADRDDRLARAHQSFLSAGDVESAARCAFWLGFCLVTAGETARGGGWLARARRLLDDAGRDCALYGYLRIPEGYRAFAGQDLATALATFGDAVAIGRRFGDADLVVLGRHGEGRVLIRLGRVQEGMALLDEVMVAVTVGDLVPAAVGPIYCSVLEACYEIFDLRRAHEWTAAFADWCAVQPDFVPFRGHCLVRRAEMMQLHGEWTNALAEARRACEEAPAAMGRSRVTGSAHYRTAELHRLRGGLAEAEEAYKLASQLGYSPQPGLSLLRFAQGQVDVSVAAIRRAAADAGRIEDRATILHASVDVLLAAGDAAGAAEAANELDRIARVADTPYLLAASAEARGAVLSAEGDHESALALLTEAARTWRSLGAPYDEARVRHRMGLAHRALGDDDSGMLELQAARSTFLELGAIPDVARIDALLAPAPPRESALTARELDVLRLVATGQTNRAIASKLGIADKTAARHVSNIFAKLSLSSRSAATAYAYEHGLVDHGRPAART